MQVALVQMTIEYGRRSANLVRALDWIDRACDLDPSPDLVVLPECCDIGWAVGDVCGLAEPVGGPFSESLAAKAREMGVHVVAGLTEHDGERAYSAGVLFDPDGDVLLRQRRIVIAGSQREDYGTGDRLRVRQTLWAGVGLALSSDMETSCLTDALVAMGAGLVVSPCAWSAEPGQEETIARESRDRIAARAADAPICLVSVNGVGKIDSGAWEGKSLIGGSTVLGPGGEELCVGPIGEEALLAAKIRIGIKLPSGEG